jgi:hypothetical protein
MTHRIRSRRSSLGLVLLVAACNSSRQVPGIDAASDVPTGGSDAGADRADTSGDLPAETGSPDVPVDTGSDVGSAPDVAVEVAADLAADVPAACGTIPTTMTLTSHLKITADNECEVFVNGTRVGMTTNWGAAVTIDVSLYVHPGRKNVIAVRGTNTSSQGGNDRGIIGELTVDADGGVAPLVVTNSSWRSAKTVPDVDAGGSDWTGLDFDDSGWSAATEIASNGDGPWGAVFGTSAAKWIWSAAVPVSTSDKPYARRTFYFSLDGTTIGGTPACPAP